MLLRLDLLSPEVVAGLADSREVGKILVEALRAHPLFMLGAQPRNFSQPVLSRLDEGTGRGARVNDAIVQGPGAMRADVAVTVFLTDPACYDGGELVIDTGYGDESYKEPAGACLVYPTSARYSVAPVMRGTRLTGELCVQSLIRDPAQRQILYDLGCAFRYFELFAAELSPDLERLRRCQEGLLRLWAEP
jgi:PKHD-type hydroxylase